MERKDFIALVESGEIDKIKGVMVNNAERIDEALEKYDPEKHQVKENPAHKPKAENQEEPTKNWNLSLPIQKKIVQSTVAFLVGKPVRLTLESEDTDDAYEAVVDVWKEMRMNSKLADLLTKLYSETEAVIMFSQYRDSDADPNDITKPNTIRARVIAKSEGYDIYTYFDEYGTLQAWAYGYTVKASGGKPVEHFIIETKEFYYRYKKIDGNWQPKRDNNLAGKINMVYFGRNEWDSKDADDIIERREELTKRKAENNDAMGNPILVLEGNVANLPDVMKAVKVVQIDPGGKAQYLYPQMSVDLIKEEREDLKELINYITDTPDFSMDSMKAIGTTSGKAIELMFFPAILKSIRNRTEIEELFDRMMEVIKNLLVKINPNAKWKDQMKNLVIKFDFVNPLPENEADLIEMLSTATGGKATLSQEEAAALNPLTKDGAQNWEKLKAENIQTDEF